MPPFTSGMSATIAVGQDEHQFFDRLRRRPLESCYCLGPLHSGGDSLRFAQRHVVSDNHNFRILEFVPPLITGMAASFVIGQPDFTSNSDLCADTARASVVGADGLAVDGSDNLWAADRECGGRASRIPTAHVER